MFVEKHIKAKQTCLNARYAMNGIIINALGLLGLKKMPKALIFIV